MKKECYLQIIIKKILILIINSEDFYINGNISNCFIIKIESEEYCGFMLIFYVVHVLLITECNKIYILIFFK